MDSVREKLTKIMSKGFEECGFDPRFGEVVISSRADLCQYQCNGAMYAAKQYRTKPLDLAKSVLAVIEQDVIISEISLAGPGFININVHDQFLAGHVEEMARDERLGCNQTDSPVKIMLDFGGANIAKPLHVGHLRSAIIGESLKRLGRFVGHTVVGDVHLGDWGLQMGMIISELERRQPDLPYFAKQYNGPFPGEPPLSLADLEEIYPEVARRAKTDEAVLNAAREATFELQKERPGYLALWRHISTLSINDLKKDYSKLDVEFDLWLGESHTRKRVMPMIQRLKARGLAKESQGALVMDVSLADDNKELPPLILVKSDGAILYGTTDLATIEQRVEEYHPDLILYVVDKRQADHFQQLFRAAYKSGLAPAALQMEHIGFGTMNGVDGRPFKTREGGIMRLKDLIAMITAKAAEKLTGSEINKESGEQEKKEIARVIGVATLKFADLMNHHSKDYVFDLERFSSFEGNTGPYLLYLVVRIRSILKKAAGRGLKAGRIMAAASAEERNVFLKIVEFPEVISSAFNNRAPNYLCDYIYQLAVLFTRFYHKHHILSEKDSTQQGAWLGLCGLVVSIFTLTLDLLGMETLEKM